MTGVRSNRISSASITNLSWPVACSMSRVSEFRFSAVQTSVDVIKDEVWAGFDHGFSSFGIRVSAAAWALALALTLVVLNPVQ